MTRTLCILLISALLAAACGSRPEISAIPKEKPTATGLPATAEPIIPPPRTPIDTLAPTLSDASYRHVPADHPTIQAAIDAASEGEIIVVSPGTFRENIDFRGKNITLRSTDPADPAVVSATIIDGGGEGSVVTFRSGETVRAVLSGFTITNGRGNAFHQTTAREDQVYRGSVFSSPEERGMCGGGIVVDGAWPTIEGNVITGNRVSHGGGGIFVTSSAFPTIRSNTTTATGPLQVRVSM